VRAGTQPRELASSAATPTQHACVLRPGIPRLFLAKLRL
jgi:hypothetical protein